jgi:hypothetical protein
MLPKWMVFLQSLALVSKASSLSAFVIRVFAKCDEGADTLLHSFDVVLSELRRCPVDSVSLIACWILISDNCHCC